MKVVLTHGVDPQLDLDGDCLIGLDALERIDFSPRLVLFLGIVGGLRTREHLAALLLAGGDLEIRGLWHIREVVCFYGLVQFAKRSWL